MVVVFSFRNCRWQNVMMLLLSFFFKYRDENDTFWCENKKLTSKRRREKRDNSDDRCSLCYSFFVFIIYDKRRIKIILICSSKVYTFRAPHIALPSIFYKRVVCVCKNYIRKTWMINYIFFFINLTLINKRCICVVLCINFLCHSSFQILIRRYTFYEGK